MPRLHNILRFVALAHMFRALAQAPSGERATIPSRWCPRRAVLGRSMTDILARSIADKLATQWTSR